MLEVNVLRKVILNKNGAIKLRSDAMALYDNEIEGSTKSFVPGEWCLFEDVKTNKQYFGHFNGLDLKSLPVFSICCEVSKDIDNPWIMIEILLEKALQYRNQFTGYGTNARLVYGKSDSLPGLTVDSYFNAIIIQINSAGYDAYRDQIVNFFKNVDHAKEVYIDNNENFRQQNSLPIFPSNEIADDLIVHEAGLDLVVWKSILQKNGYYYDHRENRVKIRNFIQMHSKKPKCGLDLFSYVGTWGLQILKGGCEHITFVDQGNVGDSVEENLKRNDMQGRGEFFRSDVFKFLDDQILTNKRYDIICSDPPAFAKNKREAKRALEGYTKLHRKCLKSLNANSLFVAASCTHYVSLEEFQQTVTKAAKLEGRIIRLVDIGMQGLDHPVAELAESANYIKYCLYTVE